MKEVKFRAWIKSLKVMADVLSIDYEDETVLLKGYKRDTIASFSQVDLLQYTGLKDKNGVEIYEGDIVHDGWNFYTPIFRNGIYMAFNPELLHLSEQEPSTQFNIVWKESCEVIGNVYEDNHLSTFRKKPNEN